MTDYLAKTPDYSDAQISNVFDEVSFWASRFGALMLDNIELRGGLNILDVGCGNGFPLFELAHRHGQSCRCFGVDVWTSALQRAEYKRRVYGLSNVAIVEANGAKMPFSSATFDLITANLVVNNVENPETFVDECGRVAKKGARFVLTTNIKGHMHEFYTIYRQLLSEMGKPLDNLAANEDHRGTRESVCALLENGGFSITRVIEEKFPMRFLDGSAFFRHWLVRIGFLDGWRSAVNARDEQAIFTELESRLNQLAKKDGELKVTIPMLLVEGTRG